jgi:hypothetical protein
MRNDLSRERNFVVLRSAVLLGLRRTQVLDYSCSILHQRPRGSMPLHVNTQAVRTTFAFVGRI